MPLTWYHSVLSPFIKYSNKVLCSASSFCSFFCCRWSVDIDYDYMTQVSHKGSRWQFMTVRSWEFAGGCRARPSRIWGIGCHSRSAYWFGGPRIKINEIYPSPAWCGSCHHSVKVPPTPLLWFATPELSHHQLGGRAVKSSTFDCLQIYCCHGVEIRRADLRHFCFLSDP